MKSLKPKDKIYLASGYMLNCIFGTNHCNEEDLFLVKKKGIEKLEMSNIIKINDYLINLDNFCYARPYEILSETQKVKETGVELIMANSSWSRITLKDMTMKDLELILETRGF